MPTADLRIGHGFDVHPYSTDPDRPLVLAGVRFDGQVGLAGHSDADAVAHACIDAVLGPTGLGDIGSLYPDSDPALAGADSVAMLAAAVRRVAEEGWVPINIDCTVVLDEPKLAPHRVEMEAILSRAVGAPVSIKAKRTEEMPGLRGGIHCFAVALLGAT